jgi:hypothetical protein
LILLVGPDPFIFTAFWGSMAMRVNHFTALAGSQGDGVTTFRLQARSPPCLCLHLCIIGTACMSRSVSAILRHGSRRDSDDCQKMDAWYHRDRCVRGAGSVALDYPSIPVSTLQMSKSLALHQTKNFTLFGFPVMTFSTLLFGASEHFDRAMNAGANERAGGKGGFTSLFQIVHRWSALPQHKR